MSYENIAAILALGTKGTTTNNNASAGYVGEYVVSAVSATNAPASGTVGDLTSISLTAGDWDATFVCAYNNNSAVTSGGSITVGISVTSGNSTTGLAMGDTRLDMDSAILSGVANFLSLVVPSVRFSLASTTTIYAKVAAGYSVATPTFAGRLSARRMR